MAIDTAADFDAIADGGDFTLVTITHAAGSNTKADISAIELDSTRGADLGGLDPDRCVFLAAVSDYTSGFGSANPVRPGSGNTVTVTARGGTAVTESAWTVEAAALRGLRAYYRLECTRRRQKGSA